MASIRPLHSRSDAPGYPPPAPALTLRLARQRGGDRTPWPSIFPGHAPLWRLRVHRLECHRPGSPPQWSRTPHALSLTAPLQRLRFLGAATFSGRVGYRTHQHAAFTVDGPPLILQQSPSGSDSGPFTPAPTGAVILPELSATWLAAWPRSSTPGPLATSAPMARFDTYVRGAAVSDLPALQTVPPECGFFTSEVFDPIYTGTVVAADTLPTTQRIRQSFSVFSFLRMQPGADNPSTLPPGGWDSPIEAQRFVSAIQWFITDLFGPRISRVTILYRALGHLRAHLESISLLQAWASIDARVFSIIILMRVHSLWVTLLQWEENCVHLPVFYRSGQTILRIDAASPFMQSDPAISLDEVLQQWIHSIDERFPPNLLDLTNRFREVIPAAWNHIFQAPPPDEDPDPADRHQRRSGDPSSASSRAWAYNVLEKIPGHPDSGRRHNRRFVEALRPFPQVPNSQGESIEICFGYACKGLRCLNEGRCRKIHMACSQDLRTARREDLRQVRDWLARPAVRSRVRLTDKARDYPCLR